ncbi:MAG TPA: quinolinate synthase NadA [Phycisphaerae bacterium]|nr:quinolinate synthase NadA [Phycisphaerae bacterium]
MAVLYQPPLPPQYADMSLENMSRRIRAHKEAFGDRLVILGHHYQQDDVIQFADFTGDSLKLSQLAAEQENAEYVVFCGVHFMAESADILADDRVTVILPDLTAGCSMADMAELVDVEEAWRQLSAATEATIVPITYVNSSADIKAFVGRHGGACCTSSNARRVLEWALAQGDKILFLPDQHLGRNTAYAMGHPLSSMVLYDPQAVDGGLTTRLIRDAKFLLWKGYCSVHLMFTPEQCDAVRAADPQCRIIVHPECDWPVVQKADLAGSTEYIVKTITEAPDGTSWAVGTEINLVNRLTKRFAGRKSVRSLSGVQCLCSTMYRIDPKHLTWCLDELAAGRVVNRISVDKDTRRDARIALRRMLDNVHAQPVGAK